MFETSVLLSDQSHSVTIRIVSFAAIMLTTMPAAIADENKVQPLPKRKLTVAEQQQLTQLKPQLVTRFNSKDNPGDRDTWYVLGFVDAATVETKSREATMIGRSTALMSHHTDTQKKVVRDAVLAQGRTAAALAVIDHLNAPNQAAAQLHGPSNAVREGWMKRQSTQAAAGRTWVYQAFDSEGAARQYLESFRPKK